MSPHRASVVASTGDALFQNGQEQLIFWVLGTLLVLTIAALMYAFVLIDEPPRPRMLPRFTMGVAGATVLWALLHLAVGLQSESALRWFAGAALVLGALAALDRAPGPLMFSVLILISVPELVAHVGAAQQHGWTTNEAFFWGVLLAAINVVPALAAFLLSGGTRMALRWARLRSERPENGPTKRQLV